MTYPLRATILSVAAALALSATALPAQSLTGTWRLTAGVPNAPWIFELTQHAVQVVGTARQSGGAAPAVPIRDGQLRRTPEGRTLSFKADSPTGGWTITFTGTVAGDSIGFARETSW